MSFQFTDTFCTVSALAQSPYEANNGTPTYSSAYQRFTPPSGCLGGGVSIVSSGWLRKNMLSSQATFITFLSYGAASLPGSGFAPILVFLDSGNGQCGLGLSSTGALQFLRNGTAIGPSSASALISPSIVPNHGIETRVTFNGSTGQVQCYLDGTLVIALTGSLNTITTANAFASQVQIGGTAGAFGFGSAVPFYTDYVRVWDGTGSTQNAIVGLDRQPITKVPSGVGTNSNMTPNGLTPGWKCVSVVPPNSSDYVSANGAAVIDDYVMPSAGLTQAPSMVVASSYYEKDDGATRTYTNGVLSGSSTSVGSTYTANSAYTWVQNCIPLDPATGIAWTASGADAAHFLHEELT